MAFAVSTIIAGAGLGLSAYGAYENYEGTKAAAGAQAAAAQDQAQIAKLQAGNVDVEQQELGLQTQQQQLQIQTNKSVIGAEQAQADIQQQASSLDATRRIRQAIRNGIVMAGTSLNVAADSGANQPGGTAVRQARGNISNETNTNVQGVAQNFEAGTQTYNINKQITNTELAAQDANSAFVQKSQALQSQALETQRQVYALGGASSSNYAEAALAGGQAALGSGLMSLGGAAASNYGSINKLTNYFAGPGTTIGNLTNSNGFTGGWFQ